MGLGLAGQMFRVWTIEGGTKIGSDTYRVVGCGKRFLGSSGVRVFVLSVLRQGTHNSRTIEFGPFVTSLIQ